MHICLYRRPRRGTGGGDLGIHFGDIPEFESGGRPDARLRDALGFRRSAHAVLSENGGTLSGGICISLLLRYDGRPVDLGQNDGSGDKRGFTGENRRAAGSSVSLIISYDGQC